MAKMHRLRLIPSPIHAEWCRHPSGDGGVRILVVAVSVILVVIGASDPISRNFGLLAISQHLREPTPEFLDVFPQDRECQISMRASRYPVPKIESQPSHHTIS